MMTQFDARIYGDAATVFDILSVLAMGGAVTDFRRIADLDNSHSVQVTVVNSVFVDDAEIRQAVEETYGVGKYDNAVSVVTSTIVRGK